MGKNPSFPFYPSDWTRDLDDQDLEIEGAWIRICCRLWWMPECGKATKPIKEWSKVLRKTERKTLEIFQKLIEKGIASGEVLDNQNVTIINRRMMRQSQLSQIRQEVGRLGGNPKLLKQENNLDNQKDNQKQTPSSSSSFSSSKNKTYSVDFLSFYQAYPRKVAKLEAWKSWEKCNGDRPDISIIINAVERQKKSVQWKKDNGQFIPHPATWINKKRWEDEVNIEQTTGPFG